MQLALNRHTSGWLINIFFALLPVWPSIARNRHDVMKNGTIVLKCAVMMGSAGMIQFIINTLVY